MENKIKKYENDKEFINSFKGQPDKKIEERLKNISLVCIEKDDGTGNFTYSNDFFIEKFKTDDHKRNPKNVYDEESFLNDMKYEVTPKDKYSSETRVLFYNLKDNDTISNIRETLKRDEKYIDFYEDVSSKFYENCDKGIEFKDVEKEENLIKTLGFLSENIKKFDMDLTFKNGSEDKFSISIKDEKNNETIKITDSQLNSFLDKTIKYIVCNNEELDLLNCGVGLDLDDYEETRTRVKDIKESDMAEEKKAELIDKAMFQSYILSEDINKIDFTLPTYYSSPKDKSEVREVNFNYSSESHFNEMQVSFKDKWNTPYEQFADKEKNIVTINGELGLLLQDKDFFKDFFEEYQEKNYLDKDISHNLVMVENMNKYEEFENTVNNLNAKVLKESFEDTMKEVKPNIVYGETMNKKAMKKFNEEYEERFSNMSTSDKYQYITNNAKDFNVFLNENGEIVDFEYERFEKDIDFDENVNNIIKEKFNDEKQKLSIEILDNSYDKFVIIPLAEMCDKYEKKADNFNEKKEQYISKFTEKFIEEYSSRTDVEKNEKALKNELKEEVQKHIVGLSEKQINKAINNYLEKNELNSLKEKFTFEEPKKEKNISKEKVEDKEIDF